MYVAAGILVIIGILGSVLLYRRKKQVICKICKMSACEKYCRLNQLTVPWGFCYLPSCDIMTSVVDAWQREFGYHALFDRSAPQFNMVFDCLPIYFDYQGKTWLIECWKGQYGINTGGEIGVYCADRILSEEEYEKTLFHSISDTEMLFLSMALYKKGCRIFETAQRHWWLTGFRMGQYSTPKELAMKVSVTCLDCEMLRSFVKGLKHVGYQGCELEIFDKMVSFTFSAPVRKEPEKLICRIAQWKNKGFCRLYCLATKPFTSTPDRLLYLYGNVPFAFRHMLCFKRSRKQDFRKCRKKRGI